MAVDSARVCHTGLEPQPSRPRTGLLLTRASLALDRPPPPKPKPPVKEEGSVPPMPLDAVVKEEDGTVPAMPSEARWSDAIVKEEHEVADNGEQPRKKRNNQ